MTFVLIAILAALVWMLAPKPLPKGYRVRGRFKGRAVTFNGTVVAEIQLRGGRWHVESPYYPFDQRSLFHTRNGAVRGAIEAHRRARDLNLG